MFAFADFKDTWVKTRARAAGRFLALLKNSQTLNTLSVKI
jgi:hypothetical protein